MPRLSLDQELDKLLEESLDETRYRDVAMVWRRLTLSSPVPEGARLVDATGRAWVAGEVAEDGSQPVTSEVVGASADAVTGLSLRGAGYSATLRAEVLAEAGGVWDAQRNDWRKDVNGKRVRASQPVVVDLMESQIETARWAAERVLAFREQRPHPQAVAELFSDRRAGKTFLGVLCVLLMGIDCPAVGRMPLVAWMVSTQHSSRDELDRIIKAILPPSLYVYRELPKRQYTLANGAILAHKTIDDVEAQLRSGYVDICLLNEAALMPFSAYNVPLRGTQDRGGFLVLTTNKPKRSRGAWVVRLADGAEKDVREGRVPAVKLLRLDPKKNAAIAQTAKSTIDQALRYAIEEGEGLDEGVILEADAKLCTPPFEVDKHVKTLPIFGLLDVTAEVTKRLHGRSFAYVVGADFQQQNAATAFRVMARDARPESLKDFTLVAVRSWFLRGGGDEDDLIDCMVADKFTPDNTFVVGDWSGDWQKGDHGYGPVSFEAFKSRGYEIVGATKKKTQAALRGKNPDVEQNVGKLRTFIADGRFLVAAGEATAGLQKALLKCDARVDTYGNLRPKGIHAHLIDTCRYPLWFIATRIEAVATTVPSYVTARR